MHYSLRFIAICCALTLMACGASKQMTADLESTRTSLSDCQDELNTTQQALAQARSQMGNTSGQASQLQSENAALRNDLANAQAQLASTESQLATVTQQMQASSDNYGVWFRVQIGAYEQRQIDQDLQTTDQLELERRNEMQKVSLGRFRKYEDAKKLQTQLQGMGLRDAWVVSYKDGQRVPIETVLNK